MHDDGCSRRFELHAPDALGRVLCALGFVLVGEVYVLETAGTTAFVLSLVPCALATAVTLGLLRRNHVVVDASGVVISGFFSQRSFRYNEVLSVEQDGWWPGYEIPSSVRPDWAVEYVSAEDKKAKGPSAYAKLGFLAGVGVPWCWLVDESSRSVTVFRLVAGAYVVERQVVDTAPVALSPFESELSLHAVWGDSR